MSFEADTTATAFDCFAVSCTLDGVTGTCVLNKNAEVLDENGQVIARITLAEFKVEFGGGASFGDLLVVGDSTYELGQQQTHDGYIVGWEVHKR